MPYAAHKARQEANQLLAVFSAANLVDDEQACLLIAGIGSLVSAVAHNDRSEGYMLMDLVTHAAAREMAEKLQRQPDFRAAETCLTDIDTVNFMTAVIEQTIDRVIDDRELPIEAMALALLQALFALDVDFVDTAYLRETMHQALITEEDGAENSAPDHDSMAIH